MDRRNVDGEFKTDNQRSGARTQNSHRRLRSPPNFLAQLSLTPYRFKLFRMKRSLAVSITLLLCLSMGFAQDWAKQKLDKSPRHGEWVQLKHDNRTVQAFVVYPETKAKAPVVIVIHEIFGLTDWARSVADQLAANGYIAIAPDLLSGMGPKGGGSSEFSSQEVGKAISTLNPDQITADLNATADYAKKIPAANGKITVAGFCWGGGRICHYRAGLWFLCR
jgi:carboxymethylenebutenolidase